MTWYLDQVFREIIHFHYIFLLDQVPLKVAEVVSCKKFTISLQLYPKKLEKKKPLVLKLVLKNRWF